jgi:hypothetical protein
MNILLPEGQGPVKSKKRCPACNDKLLIGQAKMKNKLVCKNDGLTFDADHEETRPTSSIVSIDDKSGMLVQPNIGLGDLDDLPPGAQLIREVDIRNETEITPASKRKSSQSADLALFL